MYFDDICLTVEPAQTYKYDDEGNVINVTDDNANDGLMDYDENGIDLKDYNVPTSEEFDYSYDNKHQVTGVNKTSGTNPQTAEYTYDEYGNITNVTLTANGDQSLKMISSAVYTPDGNYLSQTVNELSKITKYGYDSLTKLLKFVEDANSIKTAYTYDNRDIVTKIYVDLDGDDVADSTEAQVGYVYRNNRLAGIDTSSTGDSIQ